MLDDADLDLVRGRLLRKAAESWGPVPRPASFAAWLLWVLNGRGGSPVTRSCLVVETRDANTAAAECWGETLRAWVLDEHGLREVPPGTAAVEGRDPKDRNRFLQGHIAFHIDAEHERVVWNELFGPLYGTGGVYDVAVRDGGVQLSVSGAGGGWIS